MAAYRNKNMTILSILAMGRPKMISPLNFWSIRCGSHTKKAVANARYSLFDGGTGAIGFDLIAEAANVGSQHLWINGVVGPQTSAKICWKASTLPWNRPSKASRLYSVGVW